MMTHLKQAAGSVGTRAVLAGSVALVAAESASAKTLADMTTGIDLSNVGDSVIDVGIIIAGIVAILVGARIILGFIRGSA